MKSPAKNWTKIGKEYYSRHQAYSLEWTNVEIAHSHVAAAPNGGFIAVCRKLIGTHSYTTQQAYQTAISVRVFSNSGSLISTITWPHTILRGVGWTDDEFLTLVSATGDIRIYRDVFGNFFESSLGPEASAIGVIDVQFTSKGLIARLIDNSFVSVPKLSDPVPSILSLNIQNPEISSWCIRRSSSRSTDIAVFASGSLYIIDSSGAKKQPLQQSAICSMQPSPSAKYFAAASPSGLVSIHSLQIDRTICEVTTDIEGENLLISWIGDDAVLLSNQEDVRIIDLQGSSATLYYDSAVAFLPEQDGCRVLSDTTNDFIYKLDNPTVSTFRIGSTEPSAILLDCVDQLEKKSLKADENIRIIGDKINDAVDDTLHVSQCIFDRYWQKRLLKAASFGKSVIPLYNSDDFFDTCCAIRVLNSVRDPSVGIWLTYNQYTTIGPDSIIDRLMNRRQYGLALKISEYLSLPVDRICVRWACEVVKSTTLSDQEACDYIFDRIKDFRGIPYSDIAETAFDEGRIKLSTMLLKHEARDEMQIPLLLRMEEDDVALQRAEESKNTDLILYTILILWKKLSLAEFFRLINSRPLASNVVRMLGEIEESSLLKDYYYQGDNLIGGALTLFADALEQDSLDSRLEKAMVASKVLADVKTSSLNSKNISEYCSLLNTQQKLESEYDHKFLGLSLYDTLSELISIGRVSRANSLSHEFKTSAKMYAWIKLRSLISARNWQELEKISRDKKSPIGFEPYVNACLDAGRKDLAALFIPKCVRLSREERAELWIKAERFQEAGEEAYKNKNKDLLSRIVSMTRGVTNSELSGMLREL
ncbi:hypothetical protein CANCADRAFT_1774 [Tortispora caseinolytica NRRL Y-17796]|uniref:Probable vacuolar protein sorting-associated protein 16 homolog n=1 Tax=Tortispora caseinolytica NRRL Y-17796 TaxID=767744 RepID=A0A1E4TE61_9ASCO|nr:hypothetical protein CANCADRAFT_1774 [Tortispora caseinolytica NRRL Y-17796]